MMDASAFAMWKFKSIEGILRYVRPMDFTSTRYDDTKVKAVIQYDLENRMATIVYDHPAKLDISCKFSELADTLKQNNMYLIRTENRHENSKIPYDGNPDK